MHVLSALPEREEQSPEEARKLSSQTCLAPGEEAALHTDTSPEDDASRERAESKQDCLHSTPAHEETQSS